MQCDYKTNDLQFVQKYYRLQKKTENETRQRKKLQERNKKKL